jgi:hypothetical protein
MSRIAIMIHLANGGTEYCGANEGTNEPMLYALLSDARAELQAHLKDVTEAAATNAMESDHNVADYYLKDTKTGTTYSVAWAPGATDLLVKISHMAALAGLATAFTAGGDELVFQLDAAKTAADFGYTDHRDTVVVLLPSQDGPTWDKHAIAPSSMLKQQAIAFVNDACARANRRSSAIDDGTEYDDGISVSDRINLYLEEAGFTVISGDEGNLCVAQAWDQEPEPQDDEAPAPAP